MISVPRPEFFTRIYGAGTASSSTPVYTLLYQVLRRINQNPDIFIWVDQYSAVYYMPNLETAIHLQIAGNHYQNYKVLGEIRPKIRGETTHD